MSEVGMVITHNPMTWWGHGVALQPKADVSVIHTEEPQPLVVKTQGSDYGGFMAFIFQRLGDGVYMMEGYVPSATYNIHEARTRHIVGGAADVQVIKQPNADCEASKSQSSECSPEA